MNQGELSSDHTESINLGEGRGGYGASAQITDIQIIEVRQPGADNSGSVYEPTAENLTTELATETQPQKARPPKAKTSVKSPNPYLEYFNGKAGRYRAFCWKSKIPHDVELRLVREEDITFFDDHITIPLLAITEGGLQFPVNLLLRQFLHEY